MRNTEHLDVFVKQASQALAKPYGLGDAHKAVDGYNRSVQSYAQPQGPSAASRPDTVSNQKSLQPPPV